MDEDRLEDERSYWEQRIDREYNRKYPRYATIRRIRSTIQGIESKLRATDTFVSATNGVYRNAMALLEVLSRKDMGIDSVSYNAKENLLQFEEVNEDWLLELEKGSAKRYLLKEGVTNNEISRLEDLGFTVQEIKEMCVNMETVEEKRVFMELAKGRYKEAFQTDPKGMSAAAPYILVYYANRLAEHGNISRTICPWNIRKKREILI